MEGLEKVPEPAPLKASERAALQIEIVAPPGTRLMMALAALALLAGTWVLPLELGVFVMTLVLGAWVVRLVRYTVRHRKAIQIATRAIEEHSDGLAVAEALERAAELVEGLPTAPELLLSAAEHRFEAGDPRGALSLIRRVRAVGKRLAPIHQPSVDYLEATVLVTVGETDAARGAAARLTPPLDPLQVPLRVLCDARDENYDSAIARVDSMPPDVENALSARQYKDLRLLRAFAVQRRDGDGYRSAADPGEVRAVVDLLGPSDRGRWDGLAAQWPELRAFLREHDLLGDVRES